MCPPQCAACSGLFHHTMLVHARCPVDTNCQCLLCVRFWALCPLAWQPNLQTAILLAVRCADLPRQLGWAVCGGCGSKICAHLVAFLCMHAGRACWHAHMAHSHHLLMVSAVRMQCAFSPTTCGRLGAFWCRCASRQGCDQLTNSDMLQAWANRLAKSAIVVANSQGKAAGCGLCGNMVQGCFKRACQHMCVCWSEGSSCRCLSGHIWALEHTLLLGDAYTAAMNVLGSAGLSLGLQLL